MRHRWVLLMPRDLFQNPRPVPARYQENDRRSQEDATAKLMEGPEGVGIIPPGLNFTGIFRAVGADRWRGLRSALTGPLVPVGGFYGGI
jgi:hypothetical protein